MSLRDGQPSIFQRLLIPIVPGLLALLAYGVWPDSNSNPDEAPIRGATPSPSPERPDNQREAKRAAPVQTEPQGGKEPSADERSENDTPDPPHKILAEMRRAWDCYQSPDCRLGEDQDPKAEYFEAGGRIAAGMRSLIEQHEMHRIGDAELARAAYQVLTYDSGRARAAAIEALRRLPPADEHLEALTKALDQHHDEKLFELAMPELKRYAEQGHRAEVDAFLQSNLRTGAHFPARTIARELEPFLTPDNIDTYRKLARELPPESRRTKLLQKTLESYRKRQ